MPKNKPKSLTGDQVLAIRAKLADMTRNQMLDIMADHGQKVGRKSRKEVVQKKFEDFLLMMEARELEARLQATERNKRRNTRKQQEAIKQAAMSIVGADVVPRSHALPKQTKKERKASQVSVTIGKGGS